MRLVIDVSSNNVEPDWRKLAKWRKGVLRRTRVEGVYIKATEGTSYVFRAGADWVKSAMKVGLRTGRYHFAQPRRDNAKAEAAHFAAHVGHIAPGDLRPVLDLEVNPSKMNWLELSKWAKEFSVHFKRLTGRYPAIYMSSYWAHNIQPTGGGLWLASWSNQGVPFHAQSPGVGWAVLLHQFTSEANGRSPYHPDGVLGRIDINVIRDDRIFVPFPKKKKAPRRSGGGAPKPQ